MAERFINERRQPEASKPTPPLFLSAQAEGFGSAGTGETLARALHKKIFELSEKERKPKQSVAREDLSTWLR